VGAGEDEGGAVELDRQEMAAVDVTADAGVTAEAGLARTEEAATIEVIVSCPAADEVAAGEVATADASSGLASQEDPREVAREVVKEALAGMRASEPPEMVARASSGPGPVPGAKADMPVPGMEIGATTDPLLFGATSHSEKASQGAHTAQTVESGRSEASPTPRAAAKGASGGRSSRLRPGLVRVAKVPPASSQRNGRILLPMLGVVEAVKPRART
jgi:hypothetical protein